MYKKGKVKTFLCFSKCGKQIEESFESNTTHIRICHPDGNIEEIISYTDDVQINKSSEATSKSEKTIIRENCTIEAEFKGNKANGKGKVYYADGRIFEGKFQDDKANGKGILYFPYGEKYERQFKNDKQHGHGIIFDEKGIIFEGKFRDRKKWPWDRLL